MAANGTDDATAETWSTRVEAQLSEFEFELAEWRSITGHQTPAEYRVERDYAEACHSENMAAHGKTHAMLDLLIRKVCKIEGLAP